MKNLIIGLVVALAVVGMVMPAMAAPGNGNGNVKGVINKFGTGGNVDNAQAQNKLQAALKPMFSGIGFATSGDEYHVVLARIVKAKDISAEQIKEMLSQNMTPAEIRDYIKAITDFVYKGKLVFGGTPYDLKMERVSEDELSFSGSLTTVPKEKNTTGTVAGTISVTVAKYENAWVGVGTISLNGKEYKLLMNMLGNRGNTNVKKAAPDTDKMDVLQQIMQ